jgi:hypothetical protein
MSQEKKGNIKITMDIEINEALMDMAKDCIAKMPEMMAMMTEKRKEMRRKEWKEQ